MKATNVSVGNNGKVAGSDLRKSSFSRVLGSEARLW